ncbi:MAG: hypothetical protein ACI32F_04630 [Allobaculum sp.]
MAAFFHGSSSFFSQTLKKPAQGRLNVNDEMMLIKLMKKIAAQRIRNPASYS